jgi:hypothetical protein
MAARILTSRVPKRAEQERKLQDEATRKTIDHLRQYL